MTILVTITENEDPALLLFHHAYVNTSICWSDESTANIREKTVNGVKLTRGRGLSYMKNC